MLTSSEENCSHPSLNPNLSRIHTSTPTPRPSSNIIENEWFVSCMRLSVRISAAAKIVMAILCVPWQERLNPISYKVFLPRRVEPYGGTISVANGAHTMCFARNISSLNGAINLNKTVIKTADMLDACVRGDPCRSVCIKPLSAQQHVRQ